MGEEDEINLNVTLNLFETVPVSGLRKYKHARPQSETHSFIIYSLTSQKIKIKEWIFVLNHVKK